MNSEIPSRKTKIDFLRSIVNGTFELSQLNVKTYTWILSHDIYRCKEYQVPAKEFVDFASSIGGNHIIVSFKREDLEIKI